MLAIGLEPTTFYSESFKCCHLDCYSIRFLWKVYGLIIMLKLVILYPVHTIRLYYTVIISSIGWPSFFAKFLLTEFSKYIKVDFIKVWGIYLKNVGTDRIFFEIVFFCSFNLRLPQGICCSLQFDQIYLKNYFEF